MERVMEDIRTTYGKRVKVRFMNVSKQETQEWTKYFGIAAIPTQIILDNNGHEIFRHTGLISAEDLDLTEYSDALVYRIIERITVLSKEEIRIRFIGGFEITHPLH